MKLIMVYENEDAKLVKPYYGDDNLLIGHCNTHKLIELEGMFEKYTWPLIQLHDSGYRSYEILTKEEAGRFHKGR